MQTSLTTSSAAARAVVFLATHHGHFTYTSRLSSHVRGGSRFFQGRKEPVRLRGGGDGAAQNLRQGRRPHDTTKVTCALSPVEEEEVGDSKWYAI